MKHGELWDGVNRALTVLRAKPERERFAGPIANLLMARFGISGFAPEGIVSSEVLNGLRELMSRFRFGQERGNP